MRRIFFPLRTSVELFADPSSPSAVTRAKEAALLYDELVFEIGLYDATITPSGGSNLWIPPDQISSEHLARSRKPIPVGAPMTVAIGKQQARGVPADDMRVMMQGSVSHAYISEFHSGILDELEQFDPDWVLQLPHGGEAHPGRVGDSTYEAIRELNFSDFSDKTLMPEAEPFLRSFVSKSFNRDAVLSAELEASFNTTPLFEPMVAHRGVETDYAGSEALSVIVSDIGSLPWEAVIEFRSHHGSGEARERLREFEHLAAAGEPQDAYDFLKRVSQEVNRGFRAAIEDLAPNLPEDLAKQVLLTSVATISVIGAPVAVLAETASSISGAREFNRSWIAALMKIQEV